MQKWTDLELITHNLFGVLIQILCFRFLIYPYNIIFTIIIAFLSHFLVDALVKFTYHTPEARKDDKFWVIWHVFILSISIVSLIIFIVPFWLGILFANFVDIWDWLILRPIQKRVKQHKPKSNWGDKWYIHVGADWLRGKLFSRFPDWTYKREAITFELIIIAILSIIIIIVLI